MPNFDAIAFSIPDGLETFTIKSGKNTLVIREPIAADFLLVESLKDNPNIHERTFALAERLAVSWNGKPGISAIEIGMLNREGYGQLLTLVSGFFLDIMPDVSKTALQKYLSDQSEQLSES